MPQPIKYTTTNVSSSVRLGNIALGVNDVNYGPSSTTSWAGGVGATYDGYAGGYVIYYLSGTNIRVRTADTFTLQAVAGQIMGTTYASNAAAFAGLVGAGYTVVNTTVPPNLVTSGSVFNLDSGLVMSYPQVNTTWYDISGNANNSTLTNGPTFDSTTNSIVFDGTNDYVNGPAISSQFTGDMTAEGWFKVTAGSSDWVRVIGTGGNAGNRTFGLWYNSPNNYILWQRFGGQDPSILITQPLTNGKWYYFAATTIGNAHVLYLNNQVMGTATASGPWPASGENITMGYAGFHAYINGNISRGRLYTRGLSTSEINQNYYQGNIVTSSLSYLWDAGNLVSYPGSGTTTYNLTGSVNGTLVNGLGFSLTNGGVWVYDGTDDAITLDSTINLGGSSTWTVSMWVRANAFNSNYGELFSNNSGGPVTTAFGLTSGYISYQNYDGNWQQHLGNTALSTNTWYHLTWANSSNSMTMYVNGVADSSAFASNDTNSGPVNSIGRNWYSTFNGRMGLLAVYVGKRLTVSEIQQNFNAQRNRFNI